MVGGSVSSFGNSISGGLVYRNAVLSSGSQVINCLSTAVVEGGGGFCGVNEGVITNCYYDSETSGQSDTGKGLPRTTAQMNREQQIQQLAVMLCTQAGMMKYGTLEQI